MQRVFSACPHDIILDPEKWSAFINYVQEKCGLEFEFKRFEEFDTFAKNFEHFSFVYAHPLHAIQLSKEQGFLPVAMYTETYDEAVIISQKHISGSDIKQIEGKSVACIHGSPSHAALLIDMHTNKVELEFDPISKNSYPKVLMAVSIGEADYGVILKSVWDDMLTMKERVRVHYTTSSHSLVHVFMLNPSLEKSLEKIRTALTEMATNKAGKEILNRLKCPSISPFGPKDLEKLAQQLLVCHYD